MAQKGVRVNTLSPGMIDTTFHDTFTAPEVRKNVASATLVGREGTVEDVATVCLANGARVAADSTHPVGSAVAVSLRPERAHIGERGIAAGGMSSVDGVVDRMTYLGNARVYTVRLDWMEIEVREENRPGAALHAPGAAVTVSWDPSAVSVVAS